MNFTLRLYLKFHFELTFKFHFELALKLDLNLDLNLDLKFTYSKYKAFQIYYSLIFLIFCYFFQRIKFLIFNLIFFSINFCLRA